jgi:hypothetical protein
MNRERFKRKSGVESDMRKKAKTREWAWLGGELGGVGEPIPEH